MLCLGNKFEKMNFEQIKSEWIKFDQMNFEWTKFEQIKFEKIKFEWLEFERIKFDPPYRVMFEQITHILTSLYVKNCHT